MNAVWELTEENKEGQKRSAEGGEIETPKASRGGEWGGGVLPSPLLAVPNVTAHAHQRPVYQLQLFNVALLITFAL